MTYFIAYDIAESKRRQHIAKLLEDFGLRVQYSFFQCDIQPNELQKLKTQLLSMIDEAEDSLHIYPLCEDCQSKTQSIGNGSIFVMQPFQVL